MNQPVINCQVCGKAVDPKVDILFGAAGKPLFAAHTGECAEVVRNSARVLGEVASTAIKHRAPKVWGFLQVMKQAFVVPPGGSK